ncbi:MAG: restriction endonuclease subunit S [Candidatus Thiodiazotropha sp.]
MSEAINTELPEGWESVPLKNAVHVILGQSPKSSTYNEEGEGLPFFQGKTEFGEIYPTVRKWCTEPKKIAEAEDILVSVRAPVGPTNLAPYKCAIGRGLAAIRPLGGNDPKYFLYLVRRHQESLAALGTGTTFGAISGDTLKNFVVPVAPIAQQERIVAKIEELFSHIDAGIKALKKAKQLLKQYRQSVLKAAVTGELTKEWREANKDKLEPTSQLLERILKERRQKWEEQQLEQFKAKGKMPKNDKWKVKYSEPTQDIEKFFYEPDGWAWTEIGTITDMLSGHAFKKAEYTKSGVRLFQIANVSFGYAKWDEVEYLPESYLEEWKYLKLEAGDVLMALNRPLLSKQLKIARLGKSDVPSILYQRVGKFQFYSDIISDYFLLYMQSPYYINRLEEQLQGVNIPFINKGKLLETPISIPSSEEELRLIVGEANKRLDGIARLETEIDEQMKKSERNKQSVLVSAFSGNLKETEV